MEDFFKIGRILKPQGVKGEVKVEPLTSDILRFKNIKEVFIDDIPTKVVSKRISGNTVFLCFFGISDRNNAELLRNKYISVKREDAIPLSENTFFIADIIGSQVMTEDGETVGKIVDITNLKTDIFTVLTASGKVMRFPFLKDLLVKADLENQIITVNKKRLSEVSVYED